MATCIYCREPITYATARSCWAHTNGGGAYMMSCLKCGYVGAPYPAPVRCPGCGDQTRFMDTHCAMPDPKEETPAPVLRKLEYRHSCDDCSKRYEGCTLVNDMPLMAEDWECVCDNWEAGSLSKCTTARRLLEEKIGFHSQDLYCAGWLSGIEYDLWANVLGERKDLLNEQRRELKALSIRVGGWFVWGEKDSAPRFVPMDEWLRIYERRPSCQ